MIGFLAFLAISGAAALALIALVMAHAATHPPRHTAAYALRRGLPMDPAACGLSFDEWSADVDGPSVWDIRAHAESTHASPQAACAVCIHGWGESRIDLLAATREILPLFERVIAFDRRGHGDSLGCARLGDARDIADIAAIASSLDGSPFVLLATGSGAALARSLAHEHDMDSKPLGIVAINPVADDEAAILAQFRAQDWPIQPFWTIARFSLRLCGIRPGTEEMGDAQESVPTLILHRAAHQKLPESEVARIREWISVRTAHSGIEPE